MIALSVLLLSGCVPKSKYDEVVAQNAELQDRVDAMKTAMATMSTDLTRTRTDLETTTAALEAANRELAAKIAEAGQMKQNIDEMARALEELERRKAQTDQALQSFRDLVKRFQALIDAGTLKVKIIDGRMVVELASDILFSPGSASLSREGKKAISDVGAVLASIPDRQYQVAGHTDNVPISNDRFPSNWHLGAGRAISVTELLIKSGVDGNRISAASHSDFLPVDTNRTKEGRAANRRIDIVIVPDLSMLPGYDELQAMSEK